MMDGYDPMEKKNDQEIDDLEDDLDDDFMRNWINQRKGNIIEDKENPKFGFVREISKADYKEQMNNAPKGVFCVLMLYQSYIEQCQLMEQVLEVAAKKYENIKFMKGIATKVVEKYNDVLCPTLIVYKDGKPFKQLVRFEKDYRKMTEASFDDLLCKNDIIPKAQLAEDEDALYYKGLTKNHGNKRRESIDSDEDDREDRGFANSKLTFKYV